VFGTLLGASFLLAADQVRPPAAAAAAAAAVGDSFKSLALLSHSGVPSHNVSQVCQLASHVHHKSCAPICTMHLHSCVARARCI
jgi:hypothetical protein